MFTKVTKQMSRSSTPTLPWVLPMGMLRHLLSSKDDLNLDVRLCTAAEAGHGKLEVYYSKAATANYILSRHVRILFAPPLLMCC
ncbi:hypothetical protein B0H10DRAFT_2087659 [Mycena sp. CBHHK59/15]|nr:hypothetical protein B0H10DRAFT_2087659 [Mycena sp. CBHHK59/15]